MKRVFVVLVFLLSAFSARTQEFPSRPITAIVPFSSGSASDVMARLMLDKMGEAMGRRFIVDNRPAAGGTVGTLAATKAAPDGYTIVMGAAGPMVVNKILMPALGYDPEKDFEPISLYASMPNIVCVSAKLPAKTLAEFIDYVRRNPNVPYGSVGNGSSQHLAGELFAQIVGAQMQHVPYRVTTQLQADLLAGTVPVGFQLIPNVIGGLKSGQVRALAVASKSRLPALPDVPTAAEAGVKDYESAAWFGFLAPKGTPRGPVELLNRQIAAAIADPHVRARFTEFGAEPVTTTPEEMSRFISAEVVRWRAIIAKGGITLE
jgi:tripartite-type tricarboxylate transporter receptor subunit TctC